MPQRGVVEEQTGCSCPASDLRIYLPDRPPGVDRIPSKPRQSDLFGQPESALQYSPSADPRQRVVFQFVQHAAAAELGFKNHPAVSGFDAADQAGVGALR